MILFVDDFNKISDLLIKARIALKITQKELAFLCDRTEEQIKAYEDALQNPDMVGSAHPTQLKIFHKSFGIAIANS